MKQLHNILAEGLKPWHRMNKEERHALGTLLLVVAGTILSGYLLG